MDASNAAQSKNEDDQMNSNLNEDNLPENLTSESVFYACDGPKEQQIRDLKRIKSLCEGVETAEAKHLLAEAIEALDERNA